MRGLGKADSFNSSGATIVPDKEVASSSYGRNTRSRNAGTGGQTNDLRLLSSQDSLGREIEAALRAGDGGMISLLNGQGGSSGNNMGSSGSLSGSGNWESIFREYAQMPNDNSNSSGNLPEAALQALRATGSFTFDLPQPTLLSGEDPHALPELNNHLSYPQPQPQPATTSPTNLHISPTPGNSSPWNTTIPIPNGLEGERPLSAHSYRTNESFSCSEYSYSATDVSEDGDIAMGENIRPKGPSPVGIGGVGGNIGELNDFAGMGIGDQNQGWNVPAGTGAGGVGTAGNGYNRHRPSVGGPVRGTGGGGGGPASISGLVYDDDDPSKRAERLEHRRSINRKSAQKHRARRKEELETLNKQIQERDMKIKQLETDLAVERARLGQIMLFLKDKAGFNPAGLVVGGGPVNGMGGGNGNGNGNGGGNAGEQGKVALGRRKSARLRGDDGAQG